MDGRDNLNTYESQGWEALRTTAMGEMYKVILKREI